MHVAPVGQEQVALPGGADMHFDGSGGAPHTLPDEDDAELDVDELVVAEAHVGKAIVIKRFHPRGRGRMGRIFKPFANLTIVVREVEVAAS